MTHSKNEAKKSYVVGVNSITHKKQMDSVKKLLNIANSINPIVSILDCPCGSGRLVELLDEYKLTCADQSHKRLKHAISNIKRNDIEYKHCDIFKTPFDRESFDLIITMLLLQHIKKDKLPALFQELSRITKNWVIISYSSKFSLSNLKKITNKKRRNTQTLTSSEFSYLCSSTGFKIIKEMYTIPLIATTKVVLLQKM